MGREGSCRIPEGGKGGGHEGPLPSVKRRAAEYLSGGEGGLHERTGRNTAGRNTDAMP
jgi:hypothetical protein